MCVIVSCLRYSKVCGFLSHSADFGCFKRFPGGVGCKDYSGFDKTQWPARNVHDHRKLVEVIQQSTTVTKQCELESKYGCCYSPLLELPYFDPIRMTIIDPMHNFHLGTPKHVRIYGLSVSSLQKTNC